MNGYVEKLLSARLKGSAITSLASDANGLVRPGVELPAQLAGFDVGSGKGAEFLSAHSVQPEANIIVEIIVNALNNRLRTLELPVRH